MDGLDSGMEQVAEGGKGGLDSTGRQEMKIPELERMARAVYELSEECGLTRNTCYALFNDYLPRLIKKHGIPANIEII